jgi:hypothetical protein
MFAGLALVILSLIPPRVVENSNFKGTIILQPKTFAFESSYYLSRPFDPQNGLYLNAQANSSVTAYLLNVDREYVQQWILDHFPEIQPTAPFLNASILEEFLNGHSTTVAWQENVAEGGIEYQYAPTRPNNITLIFSNLGTEASNIKYNGKLLNFILPSERALAPAKVILPAGFILSIPWMNLILKRRRAIFLS